MSSETKSVYTDIQFEWQGWNPFNFYFKKTKAEITVTAIPLTDIALSPNEHISNTMQYSAQKTPSISESFTKDGLRMAFLRLGYKQDGNLSKD